MRIKPEEDVNQAPFFSWHANLIEVKGLGNNVILTNDNNRYVLVLTGLKQKHFNKLEQYISQAIRETFKAEYTKSEVADKYLEQAGDFVFTKTRNKSLLAKMNNSCDQFYRRFSSIDINSNIQAETGRLVSRVSVNPYKEDTFKPNEKLYNDLEAMHGSDIFDHRAMELMVTLDLETEQVTRKILVHPDMPFYGLHLMIQHSFGWLDHHLHSFSIYRPDTPEKEFKKTFGLPKEEYLPEMELVSSQEEMAYEDDTVKDKRLEIGTRLSDYLPAKIRYIYDYGDHWVHYIEVIKTHDHYEGQVPACLEGEGNTPPENVGGISGYQDFIEIYKDKNHPEHKEYKTWAESLNYKEFDIQEANEIIKRRLNSSFMYDFF